jgi:3-demethoxyubiquinol 3-hydroxylase
MQKRVGAKRGRKGRRPVRTKSPLMVHGGAGCAPLIMPPMASDRLLEPFLIAADRTLSALFGHRRATRPYPPADLADDLVSAERTESAALMRVNHAGEVAAQALYHGQALVARSPETRAMLLQAAREESDHLAWCEDRLKELGSQPSLLNPLWYAGSFAIGALAASFGDRTSLGFVAETENQVEGHLQEHLDRLPLGDERSRAILRTMQSDEVRHATGARTAGAVELPWPVRLVMRHTARVMTGTAYWV